MQPEAQPTVRDAFTDTVGVIMRGVDLPVSEILRRTLAESFGRKKARTCLSSHVVAASDAALLGSAVARALDYGVQSVSCRPGGVQVPTVPAESKVLGATGKDMMAEFVAGYDVWCEVCRDNRNYEQVGWLRTSNFYIQ